MSKMPSAQKTIRIILPLLGIFLAASFMTSKTFEAEITTAAPPEKVWAVLMDTESYPEWNPTLSRSARLMRWVSNIVARNETRWGIY